MLKFRNSIFVFFIFSFSLFLSADEVYEKKLMVGELETIKNIFDFQYAPKAWKKEYFGWDLENEIQKAKDHIWNAQDITLKDFQTIVRNFFRSTRDYHVKVLFISTESASLPIDIKGVNGKYFITHVNKEQLCSEQYPIQLGDEITQIDGQPIDDLVKQLQFNEFGTLGSGTDRSLIENMLTHRSGVTGNEVPRGPISIQIRHANSDKLKTYQLIWTYSPEKITHHSPKALIAQASHKNNGTKTARKKINYFNKPWMTPYYNPHSHKMINELINGVNDEMTEEQELEENSSPFTLAAKKSFVPSLGRVWWSNDKFYWKAYIFETPDRHLVGYLRIPHYSDKLGDSLNELKDIIEMFEERTDALVIDQVNNPGGLLFYMYAIASLFTDQALQTPKHRMAITHEDVFSAVDTIPELEYLDSDQEAREAIGNDLWGYPVTYQFAQHWLEFCRFISDQWNQGKKFTDPYHLYGVDYINPNASVHYTKPILMLINELDFSCADFLPAILQDNHRATIFGSQTSGAGGYVLTNTFKSRFGIAGFKITGSIASRPNKKPIENLGVTPDIHYDLTEEDFQNHFVGYKKAVLQALKILLSE